MKSELLEQLEYDLWAHERWFEVLDQLPFRADAEKILRHNVRAQGFWLAEAFGLEYVPAETDVLQSDAREMNRVWQDCFKNCDPEAYCAFQLDDGSTFFTMVEEITRHVLNHGTYHRGELRGLCRANGFEGFPETDLMRYFRTARKSGN